MQIQYNTDSYITITAFWLHL